MPKLIRNPAFTAGLARLSPNQGGMAAVLALPGLIGWLSGEAAVMRGVDNFWDDQIDPNVSYATAGSLVTGARPSLRIGGMPTVEMPGAAGRLVGNITVPASYTIIASAVMDETAVGKCVLGDMTNAAPRLYLGTQSGGYPTLAHNNVGTSQATDTAVPVVAGVPFIIWGSFDGATATGRVGLNSASGANNSFAVGRTAAAGVGVGAFGNGANFINGAIGDVLIFDRALSDAQRVTALAWLSDRTGIDLA